MYQEGVSLAEWHKGIPNGDDVQIVALKTKIDEELSEKKVEVIAETESIVALEISYPNFEDYFDFSECRNLLDKHATGDWIFHIDSDEKLANDIQDFWITLKAITQTESSAAWVSIAGISFEAVDSLKRAKRYNIAALRLYKNKQGFKWHGICHETLDVGEAAVLCESEILLLHHGYAIENEELLEKAERNAKLLVREYQRNKSERNWSYLIETFSLIKNKRGMQ
jgi:hypothetical protein